MKTRPLGRTGLSLTPFGLLVGEAATAPAAPEVANWCDIPVELEAPAWTRVTDAMARGAPHVFVRVGPGMWNRSMLTAFSGLLSRIGRAQVDVCQLSLLDVERVKAGEPFRMMIRLREQGQVGFFGVRTSSTADALWVVEHTPAHCVTVDCAFDPKAWTELLDAAADAGVGVLGTAATAGGDPARARELLAETGITAFSWPARLA